MIRYELIRCGRVENGVFVNGKCLSLDLERCEATLQNNKKAQDGSLSKKHCLLGQKSDSNGFYINGKRIGEIVQRFDRLKNDDQDWFSFDTNKNFTFDEDFFGETWNDEGKIKNGRGVEMSQYGIFIGSWRDGEVGPGNYILIYN